MADAKTIQLTTLKTDADGESYFDEAPLGLDLVDFAPPAPALLMSQPMEAKRAIVLVLPDGWFGDLHPAPSRQVIVLIKGKLEVGASNGDVRQFGPGDMVLVEDTTGKGHSTRSIEGDAVVQVTQL